MDYRDGSSTVLNEACEQGTCAYPSVEPFADFVCRVLNVAQDSLLGRIVEQASWLYLFRSDPDSLRAIMEFWFYFRNLCDLGEIPPPMDGSPSSAIKPVNDQSPPAPAAPTSAAAAAEVEEENKQQQQQQHQQLGENGTSNVHSNSNSSKKDDSKPPKPHIKKSGLEPSQPNHVQERKLHAQTRSMPVTEAVRFEDFLGTQMGMVQSCIEAYFSTDWHRQRDVMETNRQHREFMEKRHWVRFLVDGYKQFRIAANSGDIKEVQEVAATLWANRNKDRTEVPTPVLAQPESIPWYMLGVPRLDRAAFLAETYKPNRDYGLLVLFHAGFSVPSTTILRNSIAPIFENLAHLHPVPVKTFLVNSTVEIDLLVQAGVQEFPTIMFLPANAQQPPPVSALVPEALVPASPTTFISSAVSPSTTAAAAGGGAAGAAAAIDDLPKSPTSPHFAQPPLSPATAKSASSTRPSSAASTASSASSGLPTANGALPGWRVFPSAGVMTKTIISAWVASNATCPVPERKIKKFVTKLVKLDQRLRFAPFRKLHSAANVVRRLCSNADGVCHILQDDGSSPHFGKPSATVKASSSTSVFPELAAAQTPRFIFLGGGAASGKTTAVMALRRSEWWEKNSSSIVVVDADEFKRKDPMFGGGPTDLHEKSTKAAEFLLVSAVNDGRHVIFDSTMMWAPFIEQTIDMIRSSHEFIYQHGPGWRGNDQPELYWERTAERSAEDRARRVPFRVSIYGIFADPAISVPRLLVRELTSGRTLLIGVLLKSLKMFSQNFEKYCALVDDVTLFDNNVVVDLEHGELPPVAAKKETRDGKLEILREKSWAHFLQHKFINGNATSLETLFERPAAADKKPSSY